MRGDVALFRVEPTLFPLRLPAALRRGFGRPGPLLLDCYGLAKVSKSSLGLRYREARESCYGLYFLPERQVVVILWCFYC